MLDNETGYRAPVPPENRRDQNAAATRTALIEAARRVFGSQGYTRTGIEELAAEAGVTTGALYHHFKNKRGLFRAVVESIEGELLARAVARVSAATPGGDPWELMEGALEDTLDACQERDVQQIVVRDALPVLGAEAWGEIEEAYAFGMMRGALGGLIEQGVIVESSAEMLARTLLALVMELAAVVAKAPKRERKRAREQAAALLARYTGALRAK